MINEGFILFICKGKGSQDVQVYHRWIERGGGSEATIWSTTKIEDIQGVGQGFWSKKMKWNSSSSCCSSCLITFECERDYDGKKKILEWWFHSCASHADSHPEIWYSINFFHQVFHHDHVAGHCSQDSVFNEIGMKKEKN